MAPEEIRNVIIDIPLSDTYFVVAHFHMVMGIAPLMVIFGARAVINIFLCSCSELPSSISVMPMNLDLILLVIK